MKQLLKGLSPYWRAVLLIVTLHIVHVYTTLLLPDYMSQLIDTGITDQGIQYAVPLAMTESSYQDLRSYLSIEEEASLDHAYSQTAKNQYHLESEIRTHEEELQKLNDELLYPIVIYQLSKDPSLREQVGLSTISMTGQTNQSLESWRQGIHQTLDQVSPNFLSQIAIQFVQEEAVATDYNLRPIQEDYIWRIALRMGVAAVISFASALGSHYLATITGAKVGMDLRQDTFGRVLAFSQREIDQFSIASLMTRTTNDIQQIQAAITLLLRTMLYAPLLAIGAALYIVISKSPLTWIVWLASGLASVLIGSLSILTMPQFRRLQTQIDRVNLLAREILTGLPVIRAFGHEDYESQRFHQVNQPLYKTNLFLNRAMSLLGPGMDLMMNGISVLIIWVSCQYIMDGQLQVGQMTAVMNYLIKILYSFTLFTSVSIQFPRAMVAMDRVSQVLATTPSITSPQEPSKIKDPRGLIEFNHVDFAFDGAEDQALTNISFTTTPGQTTAIIGGTGSGKSTLLNLLLRFYDPTAGSITMDGVPLTELSLEFLRDQIGLVPQEAILFSGTVASNLRYGDAQISDQEMQEAAQIAHADHFIEQMDQKYQARIAQSGANLSGGQRQRLSIARAIAKDPKLLLFDDSFSALDYQTDAKVRRAITQSLDEETSIIIIAQRVASIIEADQILVLDQGQIVDRGTHLELIQRSKVYRELAYSQLSQAELDAYEKALARQSVVHAKEAHHD